jgi:hypothetical protein
MRDFAQRLLLALLTGCFLPAQARAHEWDGFDKATVAFLQNH